MTDSIAIGEYSVGGDAKPLLVAGPCVIESREAVLDIARRIAALPAVGEFQFVFKASYSKDNRSSGQSYRGPGLEEGLKILSEVRSELGCPVLTDVHSVAEVAAASEVVDIVQIPAFLCRQTSLLEAAGRAARAVNVKKGQFMAPHDMAHVVGKLRDVGARNIILTERGASFGYHDLVVDFRSVPRMRETGCPVLFDVTHSLQRPGGLGTTSGGEPALAPAMARAAAAVPCDGLFVEAHPDPSQALSDGASMLPLAKLDGMLFQVARIFALIKEMDLRSG